MPKLRNRQRKWFTKKSHILAKMQRLPRPLFYLRTCGLGECNNVPNNIHDSHSIWLLSSNIRGQRLVFQTNFMVSDVVMHSLCIWWADWKFLLWSRGCRSFSSCRFLERVSGICYGRDQIYFIMLERFYKNESKFERNRI